MDMLLENKTAVIYGAGGAIGSAVARAFASEGAKLFLTGRLQAPVEAVAKDIVSAGGAPGGARGAALGAPAVAKPLPSLIVKSGPLPYHFPRAASPTCYISRVTPLALL